MQARDRPLDVAPWWTRVTSGVGRGPNRAGAPPYGRTSMTSVIVIGCR